MRRWLRRVRRRYLVWRAGTWRERYVRCAACGWVSPRVLKMRWLMTQELVCGHTVREDWHARLGFAKRRDHQGRPRAPLTSNVSPNYAGIA